MGPSPQHNAPEHDPDLSGAASDDELVGTTVSHYRILSRLGQGGMGVVYQAEDLSLDRTVAIKFLPASLSADPDADARFVHEARAVSALDHPNIAVVHDIGSTESGRRFIVMAYYSGETLRQKIRGGPLPVPFVIDYALQVARGLRQAHEHGIVHRDVKPENVIVTDRGLLKVLDFGLAKRQDVQLTVTGMTMGTLAYMSPEQTYGGEVDHRTDVWALGVVVFEMLTGRHPFMAGPSGALPGDSVGDAARVLRPDAPEELIWVIDALLRKDPGARYQEMGTVVGHLEAIIEPGSSTLQAMPTQAMPAQARPAQARSREVRTAFPLGLRIGAGAVALVIVAAVGLFVMQQRPTGPTPEARERARDLTQNGLANLTEGQFAMAQAEVERAIAADSTYSEAWSTLAAVQFRRRAFDDAIASSQRAIRLDSSNSSAYYNLAITLEETGRPEEAARAYESAIRVDSTFMASYSALGNLYVERGRPDEALRVLERAAEVAPESEYMFLIYKNMGKARLAQGAATAAVSVLERSEQLRPDWPETLALLAEGHADLGQSAQSRSYLQKYLDAENDAARREATLRRLSAQ